MPHPKNLMKTICCGIKIRSNDIFRICIDTLKFACCFCLLPKKIVHIQDQKGDVRVTHSKYK